MPPESLPPEIVGFFAENWGIFGVLILGAVVYHKPILAAFQGATRNQLIEALVQALTEQSAQFSANNELFRNLGPQLKVLQENTKAAAEEAERANALLKEAISVLRGIKDELIRRPQK